MSEMLIPYVFSR